MPRWSKYLYCTTCQSTMQNGYNALACSPEDYGISSGGHEEKSGVYFRASQVPPKELELGSLVEARAFECD